MASNYPDTSHRYFSVFGEFHTITERNALLDSPSRDYNPRDFMLLGHTDRLLVTFAIACGADTGSIWRVVKDKHAFDEDQKKSALLKAHGKTCYQCLDTVLWLAPDSRCQNCTRYTPAEIRGDEAFLED